MFLKRLVKKSTAEKGNTNKTYKIQTEHAKSIINGKLYDTEKSEYISQFDNNRVLFKTQKGNYFSCEVQNERRGSVQGFIYFAIYCGIRPESMSDARKAIGKYNVKKYIELFGQPEEA